MSSNAPTFDPLNATEEEEAEMAAGFLAAYRKEPLPALASIAFDHGHRMGRNDKAGVIDDDQHEIARRMVENWRRADEIRQDAGERSARLRRGLNGPKAKFKA